MATLNPTQGTSFVSHEPAMLATHPSAQRGDQSSLLQCIQACLDCAAACVACADACLGEDSPSQLVACIRLNQDCADICETTGRILARQTKGDIAIVRAIVEACAVACRACADECDRHAAHMEHCRVCAEACQQCERACRALTPSLTA